MPPNKRPTTEPIHSLRVDVRVEGPLGRALGPGRADLLEHIDETGSISEAARRMEMSYNRAWTLVRSTNESFRSPLVIATRGGSSRGGAELTEEGRQVLSLFRAMQARAHRSIEKNWQNLRGRLKP